MTPISRKHGRCYGSTTRFKKQNILLEVGDLDLQRSRTSLERAENSRLKKMYPRNHLWCCETNFRMCHKLSTVNSNNNIYIFLNRL